MQYTLYSLAKKIYRVSTTRVFILNSFPGYLNNLRKHELTNE